MERVHKYSLGGISEIYRGVMLTMWGFFYSLFRYGHGYVNGPLFQIAEDPTTYYFDEGLSVIVKLFEAGSSWKNQHGPA